MIEVVAALSGVLNVALVVVVILLGATLRDFNKRFEHIEAMIGNGKPGRLVRVDNYYQDRKAILDRLSVLEKEDDR